MAIAERRPVINPLPAFTGRGAEAAQIWELVSAIDPLTIARQPQITSVPERRAQTDIIKNGLFQRANLEIHLQQIFECPFGQGRTRLELLTEYASAMLARELALQEKRLFLNEDVRLYVHDAGMEIHQILLQRHLTNNDAFFTYYRAQAPDIYRGGTIEELLAQDMQREGDTHSKSRQLPSHLCSFERGEPPGSSMLGIHLPSAVGAGTAFNNSRRFGRFSQPDAISVAELGEATFAEGEVMEAISQAVKDSSSIVIVGYNNLAGISMGLGDTCVAHDPILFARSFQNKGLLIQDIDGTDLLAVAAATKEVVDHTRYDRKPSLLLVNNIYRVTDHTSSSIQAWYTPPDELAKRRKFDILYTGYRNHLLKIGVATEEEFKMIDLSVKKKVAKAIEEVRARPIEDPMRNYEDVYAPEFTYGPIRVCTDYAEAENPITPEIDHLQSTRTPGVEYTDKSKNGPELSGRMYITAVLLEEMSRDSRIVVFGEDIAMATRDDFNNLEDYLNQRIRQNQEGDEKKRLAPWDIDLVREVGRQVKIGRGFEAPTEGMALFAHLMEGKGGVFRQTQFLDWFYGQERAFNFPIREASIVGTAIGRALAGQIPVVEIQFDAYSSPAFQQIHDYLSCLRWRGAGQFGAGMVIRIMGMNRIGGDGIYKPGGIGGIGHGSADISRFLVPGIRHAIPADAIEMGCMLREAIRVAREYQEPTIVWEPINLFNLSKGKYQGPNAHIPLGEAEVRNKGNDLVIITWSNNVLIAGKVADVLEKEDGRSVGVVNTRTLGVELDWETIGREIKRANRVLIPEAGRKDGAHVAALVNQLFFRHLDAPVIWQSARQTPMPFGAANEAFVVPQYDDMLAQARAILRY